MNRFYLKKKRFHLIRESVLATLLTLTITFCISFIPIKFEFARPIRQGFLGFDIYDLFYSGNNLNNTKHDPNIILVEIADDRKAIADQINLIQKYAPAVLGIDAVFQNKGEPVADTKLMQAFNHSNNIIFSSEFDINHVTGQLTLVRSFFEKKNTHYQSGFTNFWGSPVSVIRNYPPFYKVGDSTYLAFTSVIIKKISPEKFKKLRERNNESEIINYTGNLESYTSITKEELQLYAATGQLDSLLARKIVLLGYFVKDKSLVINDLYFSQLNEQVAGKSLPDMYGVVIHANILSMILNENYASQSSDLLAYICAGIIVFLFLLFMLWRYKKAKHPKHGWFLLIQSFLILGILFIFLLVYEWFYIKISPLPIIIALVLSVELLSVYKDIALWLHKKYGYYTVFNYRHIL